MKIPEKHSTSFYVYLHRRATDGRVFYVGKGTGNRINSRKRNEHWKRVSSKHGYAVEIVQDGMQEWWALELEKELIAHHGRETLCNMTDGGEGLAGFKFSEEHKKKIGDAHRGKPKPIHVIEAARMANIGRKLSDEHRKKLSKAKAGIPHSMQHITNAADSRRGKPVTEQGKINIRKSKCKTVVCVETGQLFDGTHHATEWVKTFNPKASQAAICKVCIQKKRTAYGYTWNYQNENT
jgi:hypothetical protein